MSRAYLFNEMVHFCCNNLKKIIVVALGKEISDTPGFAYSKTTYLCTISVTDNFIDASMKVVKFYEIYIPTSIFYESIIDDCVAICLDDFKKYKVCVRIHGEYIITDIEIDPM